MNIKALDMLTIGGATRDIIFSTTEGTLMPNTHDPLRQQLIGFEYGAKISSSDCHFMLGGGGANVAVGASRLGLRVASVIAVGKDRDGDAIRADLRNEGVITTHVGRLEKYPTGFSFIVVSVKTGEHVAFLYRGANDHLSITRGMLERRRPRWLYVSSLGAKVWKQASPILLDVVRDRPVKLAWNPGEAQLALGYRQLRPMLEHTDVLLLNKDEATELLLSSGVRMSSSLKRLPVLVRALQRFGPQLVVVTDGARGATVFNGNQIFHRAAIRTRVVDTTGAGDAFGAGFVSGLRHFHDLTPALQLGLMNAASVCASVGTDRGLLSWKQVEKSFR